MATAVSNTYYFIPTKFSQSLRYISSFKMRVSHFFREVLSDLLSCIATPVLTFVSVRLLKPLRTHFIGVTCH